MLHDLQVKHSCRKKQHTNDKQNQAKNDPVEEYLALAAMIF